MHNYSHASPKDLRHLFHQNALSLPTAGMCDGYIQANLVVLPKEYADDFEKFANLNQKACPLLEKLENGRRFTQHLANHADLARDLPKYRIYRFGVLEGEVSDIEDLWQEDFVSFLIGCSFTFESALMSQGIEIRHITQGRNVPMYRTNIPTTPFGDFSGPVVVSMRPIKLEDVDRVVAITANFPGVHGAPIHMGDPVHIGIQDINMPDFGEAVTINPDEIPVFWACGVTPQVACEKAKAPLMITHAPGHMFIGDLRNDVLYAPYKAVADSIETFIETNLSSRGMGNIKLKDQLLLMTSSLNTSKRIMIVTGFYVKQCATGETDGPLGALAIAYALEKLGKSVLILTDRHTYAYLAMGRDHLHLKTTVLSIPESGEAEECFDHFDPDHLLAIERPGLSSTYRCYSMSGVDITDDIPNFDCLFERAKQKGIPTSAIGDGGNEIGMGRICDYVRAHVSEGSKICALTITDYLVLAGVSNWGGHGIAALLSLMNNQPLMYPLETESELLSKMAGMGCVDGLTKKAEATVDGLSLETYLSVIEAVNQLPDIKKT